MLGRCWLQARPCARPRLQALTASPIAILPPRPCPTGGRRQRDLWHPGRHRALLVPEEHGRCPEAAPPHQARAVPAGLGCCAERPPLCRRRSAHQRPAGPHLALCLLPRPSALALLCSKALELASLPDTSPEERKRMLSFVVVGGGPTGVELAAELHDLVAEDVARIMPQIKAGGGCPGWLCSAGKDSRGGRTAGRHASADPAHPCRCPPAHRTTSPSL